MGLTAVTTSDLCPPGRASSLEGAERLGGEEQPGGGVERQIEPVDRPHQATLRQHHQLLPQVGRREGGEPDRQAEEQDEGPGELVEPGHEESIPQRPARPRHRPHPFHRRDLKAQCMFQRDIDLGHRQTSHSASNLTLEHGCQIVRHHH